MLCITQIIWKTTSILTRKLIWEIRNGCICLMHMFVLKQEIKFLSCWELEAADAPTAFQLSHWLHDSFSSPFSFLYGNVISFFRAITNGTKFFHSVRSGPGLLLVSRELQFNVNIFCSKYLFVNSLAHKFWEYFFASLSLLSLHSRQLFLLYCTTIHSRPIVKYWVVFLIIITAH